MSGAARRFLSDANPAVGVGLVPGVQSQPIVVLIVDDSQDDELASALASNDAAAANGYGAAWSAQINGERLTIKFHLIRRGEEWERRWTYPEPGGGVLNAITANRHHVAIVPVVGDLSEFVREGNGAAIIVDVQPSRAVSSARAVAVPTTAQ
jgi:hypothetical protein